MNNGHTPQNSDNVLEFPQKNDLNNPNLGNSDANYAPANPDAWGVTPSRDSRTLGESAINGHNQFPNNLESVTNLSPQAPELGEIIDLNMPPNAANDHNESPSDIAKEAINLDHIVAKNDSISPEAAKTVEKAVSNVEGGKINPAELVDSVDEFRDAYQKNSFGDNKGAAA